jgi:hypothetical protein
MPGPKGVPRADIVALLREGHSDRYIARTLRTNPKRASRLRQELQLPRAKRNVITVDQAWTARTRATDDGHLAWTGPLREGVPVFKVDGEEYSARRYAFQKAHGREPEGRVRTGCGTPLCVRPDHVDDQPMRNRLRTQFNAIFGAAQ